VRELIWDWIEQPVSQPVPEEVALEIACPNPLGENRSEIVLQPVPYHLGTAARLA